MQSRQIAFQHKDLYSEQCLKALEGKEERMELQSKTLSWEGEKQGGSNCG